MTTWTKQKLGDIYKFQYGQGNTNPSNGGKYPVYGAGNIIGYFDEYNAENSPVIGHMGANCGTVIFGKGKHFVTYNGIMALIKNGNDPQFGYYTLLSKDFRKSIRGSAQPFISYDLLNNVDIYLPDPATQSRISKVISAYDALIENNEKRIRIMEEMAQRQYSEWFVKFKFPGHEKIKMVDSPLGKIPEKWNIQRLDEVAKVIRGTSYSTDQIDDLVGNFYLVNLKSFNRGGGFRFDGAKYFNGEVNDEQLLKQGDIVVAVTDMTTDRAVISRPARIPRIKSRNITFSADVVKIVPLEIPLAFTYYTLLEYRFTETTKNKANGANVLHLKPQAISEYKVLIPTPDLLNKFERACGNTVKLTDKLSEENEKLTKLRDLLIPQLVTGRRELKA